jgi:hypothetical protein
MVTNQTERGDVEFRPGKRQRIDWLGARKKNPVMIKGNPFLGLSDNWGDPRAFVHDRARLIARPSCRFKLQRVNVSHCRQYTGINSCMDGQRPGDREYSAVMLGRVCPVM